MYWFVSTYMTKVCETSSTFSHNLHIWYYDILPNLIIFRLCLLFLNFLENSEMGCLPSAHPLALGKHLFAECQPLGTRQTTLFAECLFCRVFSRWHLANRLFAECPKNCTRQTPWHSAMFGFPVVCTSSRPTVVSARIVLLEQTFASSKSSTCLFVYMGQNTSMYFKRL